MKRHGFIALIVALVLILGATLSYFSDYAKTATFGEAGTVDIKLTPNVELVDKDGKDILNPGDGRRVDFTVQSLGNNTMAVLYKSRNRLIFYANIYFLTEVCYEKRRYIHTAYDSSFYARQNRIHP